MQWVTESFKFIEKVPPFSATILWNESIEWEGGTLTKSKQVKEVGKLIIDVQPKQINSRRQCPL